MLLPLHDDNPLKLIRLQYITIAFIAVCIFVFLYQMSLTHQDEQKFVYGFGAIPAVLFGIISLPKDLAQIPAIFTLVTSMFVHSGLMHLAGNMLFLWVLGDNVEDSMGHKRFIIAAISHSLTDPTSKVPMIGASGAISGVIGAYLMLHPKARIKVLVSFFIMWLPAYVVLGTWIGYQFFSASMDPSGIAGIAWWAHIGGFFAGIALIFPMRKKNVSLFDRDQNNFQLKVKVTRARNARSSVPNSGSAWSDDKQNKR
jgi:membrane associated rhomboid family serine protease